MLTPRDAKIASALRKLAVVEAFDRGDLAAAAQLLRGLAREALEDLDELRILSAFDRGDRGEAARLVGALLAGDPPA